MAFEEPVAFEKAVKRALRQELPPPDFAAKVLARAAALEAATRAPQSGTMIVLPVWRKPAAWAIAAGITLAALIPTGISEYRHRREHQAREASRQLLLALDITRLQLQKTKQRLQKVSKQNAL